MRKILWLMIAGTALGISAHAAGKTLRNGPWLAKLHRPDGADIVFNFEVKDSAGKKILYVINAKERMLVDDIQVNKDSVQIKMPFFESEFKAVLQGDGSLKGSFIRHLVDKDVSVPFTAVPGVKTRFPLHRKSPVQPLDGRWATTFTSAAKKDGSFAVGEFTQQGNKVTGTFLTATGDYRFLEGVVDGDSVFLSTFDGSHAYLFTGRFENKDLVSGTFYGGIADHTEKWTARRDDKAALPDERALAGMKPGQKQLSFTFPGLNGKKVSIRDEQFKNKVVIITLMGSWCPNCMDETGYLAGWYKENKKRGVEVIGLAYERTTDFDKSVKLLSGFLRRFDVQYPVLITGVTPGDSDKGEKTLPELTGIKGFPTTIFIDKQGNVREVHTGFSGPGTGEHYEAFKNNFNRLIDQLLSEK